MSEARLLKLWDEADRAGEVYAEKRKKAHDATRQMNESGLGYDRLAALIGVSKTTIQRICGAKV